MFLMGESAIQSNFSLTSIKDRRLFGTVLSEPTKLLPFKKSHLKWMVWKHDTPFGLHMAHGMLGPVLTGF